MSGKINAWQCTGRDAELNRPFPPTLYFQIDGGPENANKSTLALMALLVASGIFQQVILSRIPRGHGHLDNDGKYGVVSRGSKKRPIHTPQVFKLKV